MFIILNELKVWHQTITYLVAAPIIKLVGLSIVRDGVAVSRRYVLGFEVKLDSQGNILCALAAQSHLIVASPSVN